nr:ABC transporter permease [Maliibacterium massiliense]
MSPEALSPQHARFIRAYNRKKHLIVLARWGLLVALVALWELAAHLHWIDPFIMSSPSRIMDTLTNLVRDGSLWEHLGVTLWETVLGFVLGTVLGTGVAVLLWWWEDLAVVLEPYLVVLHALPKIALGPILIVWVGAGMKAIVTMALLISVVVTIMGVLTGFMETSKSRIMLMRTFGATRSQIFRMVVLPANIPTIISSLKINVGMSWVGVIVGEFLVSKAGLGYLIVYGGQVFQLDLVMASTVLLAIAAALMYFGVAWLEKKVLAMQK